MAFSTSIPLFLVATICCCMVNADGERPPLPSVVDRQSRQYFVIPPSPVYNYYNPYGVYGAQFMVPPTAQQGVIDSKDDLDVVTGRQRTEDIIIAPVAAECLRDDVGTKGYGGCTKGSRAQSGNINAKFTAANQVAVVALVPNQKRFSKVKITCSDLTNTVVFTKSGEMTATTDSPITEAKQAQVVIVSTDIGTTKCSWEAS